jgi:hypothetical protein
LLLYTRQKCYELAQNGAADIGIIDFENYITEVLNYMGMSRRRNFEDFFSFDQFVSDYNPGALCRSQYRIGLKEFISQSPGSYSIFLPDMPLSTIERQLLQLYLEVGKKIGSFLSFSKWEIIINYLKS